MAAAAFTKFDPRAFLENAKAEGEAAKVAKVAKVAERSASPAETFAGFAAFAGGPTENENYEPKPEPWTDAHEERAAIVEYDSGIPRAWAEGFARLDPNNTPADVPPRRWLRFIDDCGGFLDGGWAARAAELGWGPLSTLKEATEIALVQPNATPVINRLRRMGNSVQLSTAFFGDFHADWERFGPQIIEFVRMELSAGLLSSRGEALACGQGRHEH